VNIPLSPNPCLQPGQVEVLVGDRWCQLATVTAAAWVGNTARYSGSLRAYLPALLVPADRGWVADELLAGRVSIAELDEAAAALIAEASGFQWWWVAHRLLLGVAAGWATVGGWLYSTGFDPAVQNVAALLVTVYNRLTESAAGMETTDRAQLFQQLCMPPPELPDYREMMQIVGSVVLGDMANG
jgi:hypothetical protein